MILIKMRVKSIDMMKEENRFSGSEGVEKISGQNQRTKGATIDKTDMFILTKKIDIFPGCTIC